jgi:hypothetical protein
MTRSHFLHLSSPLISHFLGEKQKKGGDGMSIINADVIREAAAAVGVSSLRDDCAMSLAADAEYRLREIVQDALNFKRHSRRRKLTTSDM